MTAPVFKLEPETPFKAIGGDRFEGTGVEIEVPEDFDMARVLTVDIAFSVRTNDDILIIAIEVLAAKPPRLTGEAQFAITYEVLRVGLPVDAGLSFRMSPEIDIRWPVTDGQTAWSVRVCRSHEPGP